MPPRAYSASYTDPVPNRRAIPPLIAIHHGTSPPDDAYVSVRYRNQWFWIDDRDQRSKQHLAFLMIMFSPTEDGRHSAHRWWRFPPGEGGGTEHGVEAATRLSSSLQTETQAYRIRPARHPLSDPPSLLPLSSSRWVTRQTCAARLCALPPAPTSAPPAPRLTARLRHRPVPCRTASCRPGYRR